MGRRKYIHGRHCKRKKKPSPNTIPLNGAIHTKNVSFQIDTCRQPRQRNQNINNAEEDCSAPHLDRAIFMFFEEREKQAALSHVTKLEKARAMRELIQNPVLTRKHALVKKCPPARGRQNGKCSRHHIGHVPQCRELGSDQSHSADNLSESFHQWQCPWSRDYQEASLRTRRRLEGCCHPSLMTTTTCKRHSKRHLRCKNGSEKVVSFPTLPTTTPPTPRFDTSEFPNTLINSFDCTKNLCCKNRSHSSCSSLSPRVPVCTPMSKHADGSQASKNDMEQEVCSPCAESVSSSAVSEVIGRVASTDILENKADDKSENSSDHSLVTASTLSVPSVVQGKTRNKHRSITTQTSNQERGDNSNTRKSSKNDLPVASSKDDSSKLDSNYKLNKPPVAVPRLFTSHVKENIHRHGASQETVGSCRRKYKPPRVSSFREAFPFPVTCMHPECRSEMMPKTSFLPPVKLPSKPVPLKAKALYQDGHLAISVLGDGKGNPVCGKLKVHITVVHRPPNSNNNKRKAKSRRPQKTPYAGNPIYARFPEPTVTFPKKLDWEVVANRALQPSFDTRLENSPYRARSSRHVKCK